MPTPLLLIIFFGLVLRLYRPLELFMYSHDQDLLSWFVKDVVYNHDFRLIGQETSVKGVFIGPLFYYAMIPFYLLTGMDPKGGILLVTAIGLVTIFSIYYVFTKMYDRSIGLLGAFLYALSYYSVMTDREVVPTTPTILWTVWLLFAVFLFLEKKYVPAFTISAILIGFIWHISMGLILTLPLLLGALVMSLAIKSKKKITLVLTKQNIKTLVVGTVIASVLIAPFLIFEIRNNFSQLQSILSSTHGVSEFSLVQKIDRTTTLASKNVAGFLWGSYIDLPNRAPLYLLLSLLLFLTANKKISRPLSGVLFAWVGLFIVFFSLNSLNLSEYYLNGMLVVWVLTLALFFNFLLQTRNFRRVGVILLTLFMLANIMRLQTISINRSGYVDRRALVSFIKSDSRTRGYPCVSVSYITEPGFNLGYRYLFFIENMHVNQPSGNAPVYSIVFPHSRVSRIDKSFGALGLVLPDYEKYTPEKVYESCSGENANLTDPLFGYVQ